MIGNHGKLVVIYTRFSSDLQNPESCNQQERKVREGLPREVRTAERLMAQIMQMVQQGMRYKVIAAALGTSRKQVAASFV